MHHALQIPEILLNIFGHCSDRFDYDVAALARTCRAFKEPALDVLWEELFELSPLVRCVPEASLSSKYSIHRSLTRIEWDILQSYTCRIRSIELGADFARIDEEYFLSLFKPPTTEPLFSEPV
ncbi:hypothetical protein EV363DRAFT_1177218 [Boletus edulis]|nr:hypothetical protein EV363DRAFT_1177218 [Boletus edulis]